MKKRVVRKINYQKIFCFISFIFILGCILWYGGRFIYLYLENEKSLKQLETTTFVDELKNQETLKQVKNNYYFNGEITNNYISYSNLLWRIVKINEDNSIMLITDNVIGSLSYGNNENTYEESNLTNWLNSDNGFEKILNEKEKYLKTTSTCIDDIDDVEDITCKNKSDNYYVGLLSIEDYLYTGGNTGFINNQKYSYLANKNESNDIWYINNDGKLGTTTGDSILGIKATITLTDTLNIKNGSGTKEDPYTFEETTSLTGSYVNLDNDIWRIYEEEDELVKLVYQEPISTDDELLKYSYSNNTYYHNDTIYGSLAYYLNNTFYKSLKYKNLIVENTYKNGYYGSDNNYQYQDIISNTIETKVSIPSIDDIILNDSLNNYFTNTGTTENSSTIYVRKSNGATTTKNIESEAYIVPCISIKKDELTIGSGTSTDPYRTE